MLQILAIILGAGIVIACPCTDNNKECDQSCSDDHAEKVKNDSEEVV